MKVIFVAGVHGVGKSTCCQRAAEYNELQWHTASALIKTERQAAIDDRSKEVLDAEGNQELLIRSIQKLKTSGQKRIILDGHFTLLKPGGAIIAIELDVFLQLELERIIMFRDDAASICNRLCERDEKDWSIPMIAAHQEAEIKRAYIVASILKVPIYTLAAFDVNGLIKAIGVKGLSSN